MEEIRNKKNLDVVILAAGIGSRLFPITKNLPKCMVDVNGKSILERVLDQLQEIKKDLGLSINIFIATGYLSKKIETFVSNKQYPIKIVRNETYETTNNMYSLFLTFPNLNSDNHLVIINGDCIYDKRILEGMLLEKQSVIAIDSSVFFEESMKVKVLDGVARTISKELTEDLGIYTSIDLYKFTGSEKIELINEIKKTIDNQILTEWTEVAINTVLQKKEVLVSTYDIEGKNWVEIDTLDDLDNARKVF